MIKVSMNGLVVSLNNENECKFREFLKLINVINERYNSNIIINNFSDNKKVFFITIDNIYKDIIDINCLTQYDVYRYIYNKYIDENKYITEHDLKKAKERFNKLYKKEECLTNGKYYSLIYMLKFIDLLINEVKYSMEEELQERLEELYKSCIKIEVEYKDIRTYEIRINLLTNETLESRIIYKYNVMYTLDSNIEEIKSLIDKEIIKSIKR